MCRISVQIGGTADESLRQTHDAPALPVILYIIANVWCISMGIYIALVVGSHVDWFDIDGFWG